MLTRRLPRSFEKVLEEWYEALTEEDRPKTVLAVLDRMYDDKVVPLRFHDYDHYVRGATWVVARYVGCEERIPTC
jgi:RNA binding exosome subunit